jgi:serine/threonine protein kinase
MVKGLGCSAAADWWALGVLLFELLTGTTPFCADSCYKVYQNIEHRRLVFPKGIASTDAALISDLLAVVETRRPGATGEASLRKHAYFKGVDWYSVERELLVPILKPHVTEEGGRAVFL